jgi:septal ring factor EnvC (AmiA/AmiB activator)
MSDDYSKLNKAELIAEVKTLEESLVAIEAENIELYVTIRELNENIDDLEARLTREQFAHEMTVEESELLRKELLDERLQSYAVKINKKFWINSHGQRIPIKYYQYEQ